jgi:hypothetical protein
VGDRVFVTCFSGYAVSPDQMGSIGDLTHHLLCLSLTDGKILWEKSRKAGQPEKPQPGYAVHGYASATPVSDGVAVYAFFGRSGVFAYSLSGELLWQASVGTKTHDWGCGASPFLFRDMVIVNAGVESGSLVALNKTSGKEVWRAGGMVQAWGTPAIVDLPGGQHELVASVEKKVLGFDPASGKRLWECTGVKDYICPSVVVHADTVFVTGARAAATIAIRTGGRGDVSNTHLLWSVNVGSLVPTPVYHDGRLYCVEQNGTALCLDAKTGKTVYRERIPVKGASTKVYASTILADGKLYAPTREDGTIVLAAGPKFEVLARNRLDDPSLFNATPAIAGSRILLRSNRALYCIGK